ncbi:hypothetical protein [Rhodanobacter soli]|uniref:Uncharacterized protein n=1 Tax=Rhodanobacter soli TaxID=590609 RepID=A0ABV2Q1I4_9GAMM
MISAEVGKIKHIYPDPSRYGISDSGSLRQAHFAVFVFGSKGIDRIDLFVQKENGWRVIRAAIDDKELIAE